MEDSKKKFKYTNLGVMMKAKKKNPDDPDEPDRFHIKMEQQKDKQGNPYGDQVFPITLANGKQIKDGDYLKLYAKKPKLRRAVEDGKMTQERYDELVKFLIFDLVLVESTDHEESGDVPF